MNDLVFTYSVSETWVYFLSPRTHQRDVTQSF